MKCSGCSVIDALEAAPAMNKTAFSITESLLVNQRKKAG
jgi:hypothetical protein